MILFVFLVNMVHPSVFSDSITSAQAEGSIDWLEQEAEKTVIAAIDMLKRQRDLNQQEAHQMLCDMAQKRKTSVVDISKKLLTVSRKLTL